MLEALKQLVCDCNLQLPTCDLVAWTSGNVSGRDEKTGYVVIKPSGVRYEELTPKDMAVVDLDGNLIEGERKPSVDTATHLYIYRNRSDVNGIVHTHSNFATSFAALGEPIPVYLTAIADEFGGPIPVGAYCQIGSEDIGKEIVRSIGASPAILMKNHGVFTIGPSPEKALKAAVMVEDVAKTIFLALMRGTPDEIPRSEVERAHEMYMTKYGQ